MMPGKARHTVKNLVPFRDGYPPSGEVRTKQKLFFLNKGNTQ